MSVKKLWCAITTIFALFSIQLVYANTIIPLYLVDANGQKKEVGNITAENAFCGVLITPNLHDLPPGPHGFHIHENASCDNKAMAAGGHLDPQQSGAHHGPYAQQGHLGDLPVLIVDQNGTATTPVFAPRLKLAMMKGHAIMIHAHGDNYSDSPEKLGGGGERIACGVIS